MAGYLRSHERKLEAYSGQLWFMRRSSLKRKSRGCSDTCMYSRPGDDDDDGGGVVGVTPL